MHQADARCKAIAGQDATLGASGLFDCSIQLGDASLDGLLTRGSSRIRGHSSERDDDDDEGLAHLVLRSTLIDESKVLPQGRAPLG